MRRCWRPWRALRKGRSMPTWTAASSSSGSRGRRRGKSGGYRTITLFQQGERAVFMYGFAKSERDNIGNEEEKEFKEAAKHVLALTEKQLAALVREGDFVEVKT
jgi:hypothetical protein